MNAKQQRFVAEYLKDLNATQAAARAGYSAKTAEQQGWRLLRNAGIAAAVAKGQEKHLESARLTATGTLEAIRRQVHGDIRALFDDKGNHKSIKDLTAEEASLIAGYEIIVKNAAAGAGHTDTVLKLRLKDQSRYVEMAAKHFGLLTEKIEHSGGLEITWQQTK